jgi:hypothetical protein
MLIGQRTRRARVCGGGRRTAIAQKTLSHHLHHLGSAGLVVGQQQGKEICTKPPNPASATQRDADGRFSLTVPAYGSGVAMTLSVAVSGVSDRSP